MPQYISDHVAPNAIRVEIAREIVERRQEELGAHLVAAACYASVAHGAALPYSDVEIVLLTDDAVEAREDQFFERDIMVECDMLPASRMLAAAQQVTRTWGIEADQYRRHLVLWDPDGFFPRLWAVATAIPAEAFAPALAAGWWWAFEIRGKFLNAQLVADHPRMVHHGWQFAYAVAMRTALQERAPYESFRTIWRDVAARGYGMAGLIDALTTGALDRLPHAIEEVWERTRAWGAPPGYTGG